LRGTSPRIDAFKSHRAYHFSLWALLGVLCPGLENDNVSPTERIVERKMKSTRYPDASRIINKGSTMTIVGDGERMTLARFDSEPGAVAPDHTQTTQLKQIKAEAAENQLHPDPRQRRNQHPPAMKHALNHREHPLHRPPLRPDPPITRLIRLTGRVTPHALLIVASNPRGVTPK
jgi:hypothetical protein